METQKIAGAARPSPRLQVGLAYDPAVVRASQQLRHRVFVQEMGARLPTRPGGIEEDRFDSYCHHLVVRDVTSGDVVSSTRILTRELARAAGGFYSESEFDLAPILALPGRLMEIGRTCVHPDYRDGTAITMLWAGLAQFVQLNRMDYLFGCASIPMRDGGMEAHAILNVLRRHYNAPAPMQVRPRQPVPPLPAEPDCRPPMPPLLKGYFRLGAWVCGGAAWDPDFGVADVLVLLDVDRLSKRYARHFLAVGADGSAPGYALAS